MKFLKSNYYWFQIKGFFDWNKMVSIGNQNEIHNHEYNSFVRENKGLLWAIGC